MIKNYFSTDISKKQASDTGMAMVMILLIIAMLTEKDLFLIMAILSLITNMTIPMIFYPVAVIWLGISHLLGTVVSKIILTLVFFILVMPVGLLRKIIGKDDLKLKEFKKSSSSVMIIRNQLFSKLDIEKPY